MKACNSAFTVTIKFRDIAADDDDEDEIEMFEVTVITEAAMTLTEFVKHLDENFAAMLEEHGYDESDVEDAEVIRVEDVSSDYHYSILKLDVEAPAVPEAVVAESGKL